MRGQIFKTTTYYVLSIPGFYLMFFYIITVKVAIDKIWFSY